MTDVTPMRPHVNPSEEFDLKHQATMDVFSTERSPHVGDWGLCLGGDATAEIGGQLMVFNWFATRADLIASIRTHLIYAFLPPQGYDLEAAQARAEAAIGDFAAHDDPLRLAGDLRNALRTHIRIDWIGPLDGLMHGDDAFSKEIRADYFDYVDVENVAPIDTANVDGFIAYLEDWLAGS